MNDALNTLYSDHWDNYLQQILIPNLNSKHDCAYPYLIHASDHYQNAAKHVMICGQESYGWGDEYPDYHDVTPAQLQHLYYDFICHPDKSVDKVNKPGRRSPYWNFSWRLMQAHPECGFIFQNVVKIGRKGKKGCDDDLFKNNLDFISDIWKAELKILKPDIIIFLTGNYDWRIRKVIGEFQTKPIAPNLDQLIFEDSSMPLCYRTNHPQRLLFTFQYRPMLGYINKLLTNL